MLAWRGIGTARVQFVPLELPDGRLVSVLSTDEIPPTEWDLIYSSARFLRPTAQAFVDFAIPALRRIDGIL